jgi:hypothetical protein
MIAYLDNNIFPIDKELSKLFLLIHLMIGLSIYLTPLRLLLFKNFAIYLCLEFLNNDTPSYPRISYLSSPVIVVINLKYFFYHIFHSENAQFSSSILFYQIHYQLLINIEEVISTCATC